MSRNWCCSPRLLFSRRDRRATLAPPAVIGEVGGDASGGAGRYPDSVAELGLEGGSTMSIGRARDLLQRLAVDPDLASQIENASTRQAMRDIINQAGFGDVSGEDVLQAIGGDVVQGIADRQSSAATGTPNAARERIYLLAAKAGDGAPPPSPLI